MADATLYRTDASICGYCLDGEGQECHTPGCAFYLCATPRTDLGTLRSRFEEFGLHRIDAAPPTVSGEPDADERSRLASRVRSFVWQIGGDDALAGAAYDWIMSNTTDGLRLATADAPPTVPGEPTPLATELLARTVDLLTDMINGPDDIPALNLLRVLEDVRDAQRLLAAPPTPPRAPVDEAAVPEDVMQWLRAHYEGREISVRATRISYNRHSMLVFTVLGGNKRGDPMFYFVGSDDGHEDEERLIRTASEPYTIGTLVHMMCNVSDEERRIIAERMKRPPGGAEVFCKSADDLTEYLEGVRAEERHRIGCALGMDDDQPKEWFTHERIHEHVAWMKRRAAEAERDQVTNKVSTP